MPWKRSSHKKMNCINLLQKYLTDTRNAFYIGRGADYAVSLEAALKLKEISYIQAEGFAAGELKHGTIALIEEGTPVIGIISEAVTGSHTRGNLREVESRGAKTLVIAAKGLEKITRPTCSSCSPSIIDSIGYSYPYSINCLLSHSSKRIRRR